MVRTRRPILLQVMVLFVLGLAMTFLPRLARADAPPPPPYKLNVTKDAHTSFKRTHQWTIDKAMSPETWNLFSGDSGTSEYTITVTRTGSTDSDWMVTGTITVSNPGELTAYVTEVIDQMTETGTGAMTFATVDCGVSFPVVLAPGASLICTYGASLPNGNHRKNVAKATFNFSGTPPDYADSGTADVSFGTPTEVNKSINVDDTNGHSWVFEDSGSTTYTRTFVCDQDAGRHDNTATIRETGQSDSASVTVNCYALAVTKDAATSLQRTYQWTIDKSADASALTLSIDQQYLVTYTVSLNATYADHNPAVSGSIQVSNPAPMAATITAVSDAISGVGVAAVDCGVTFPYTLAAGMTLNCSYHAALPDTAQRINTATASLQNYAYDSDGNQSATGTTGFTGSAVVDFTGVAIAEEDECITVSDDRYGLLGTFCADEAPKTFMYNQYAGPFAICGRHQFANSASFVTDDTGSTGSDTWTININVPCRDCTLTPGYWKTHSKYGPAPYDDTWAQLSPNGEDSPFFMSGRTWYQVLWTQPRANAYYILAHAYIAAALNELGGASTSSVSATLSHAYDLLSTYEPTDTLPRAVRDDFINTADILDQYNNGLIGPGHCSEEGTGAK